MFGAGKWEVRRTIWPYEHGWGTYHTGKKMVLDTGLPTREAAQAICDELNSKPQEGEQGCLSLS